MEIKSWYEQGDGIVINGNYHVVSKTIDPYNKYDYEEVKLYCSEHEELKISVPIIQSLTADESIRAARNELLAGTVDKINAVRWSAMSEEKHSEWKAYRQALLDIPQQSGFPDNIIWPEEPK